MRFGRSETGNVALIAAMLVPVIGVFAAGAIELGFLWSDKGKLQAAADAAALIAAHEMALAGADGVAERAEAAALAQTHDVAAHSTTVEAEAALIEDGTAVQVVITSHRDSFFGNLLPPGGFNTRVEAVASGVGQTPLCVLAHGRDGTKTINAKDRSKVEAEGCLIHSNEGMEVEPSALISAGAVQAVDQVKGITTPKADVGAEEIEDPFTLKALNPKGACLSLVGQLAQGVIENGLHVLPPGRHCQKIEVKKNGQLRLAPGEHYFQNGADIILQESAQLHGQDVVLLFDKNSKFEFKDSSIVDLEGRRSGDYAGFLIATQRDNTKDFIIWSSNVRNLLGVIYIPAAKLIVQGKTDVAEESAWTVIVAEKIELKESPTLVINRNYAVGGVPVPPGVGPTRSEAVLSR